MSARRLAAVLVLVPVFLAAVWWIASDPAATTELPEIAAPAGADGAPGAADPLTAAARAAEAEGAPGGGATGAARPGPARVEAAAGAGVAGTVVDAEGAPVAGAEVSLRAALDFRFRLEDIEDGESPFERMRLQSEGRDEPKTATGPDGRFRLRAPVDEGRLDLTVLARGFQPLTRRVPRPERDDVQLGALALERGAVLAGRVVDAAGQPIAGAMVRALPPGAPAWAGLELPSGGWRPSFAEARTDARGRFELAHVRPGPFALAVRSAEHPPATLEDREVEAGAVIDDLLVVLRHGAEIVGRVVGAPPGESLRVLARSRSGERGAFLGMDGGELMDGVGVAVGERSVEVGEDGKFELRGLDAERAYRVWAVQGRSGMLRMSACTEPREVPAGTRGVELVYAPGVSVTVRVVDAVSAAPLRELRVEPRLVGGSGFAALFAGAMGGPARFRDYPDGLVTIAHLRPKEKQKLTLRLEALGYAPFLREGIELPLAGTLDLGTVRLQPAPVVRVRATAGGAPVADARVELRVVEDEAEAEAESAAGGGTISFSTSFRLGAEGGAGGPEAVFHAGGDDRRSGRTDADGWCVLNSFPAATVRVTVRSDDHAPYESEALSLPAEDFVHHAPLVTGGEVAVLVVDQDGQPVAEASVQHAAPGGPRSGSRTDARGVARFEHLAPGTHRFRVPSPASGSAGSLVRSQVTVNGAEPGGDVGWEEVVVADRERSELTLRKTATGALTGVVRENGVPLARARVAFIAGRGGSGESERAAELGARISERFGGGSTVGRSDGDGHYRLADLPAGEHRLRVTHRDRAMAAVVPVVVREGEQTFDVDLDTTVLQGRVSGSDGKPIEGARVTAVLVGAEHLMSGVFEMAGEAFGFGGREARVRTDGEGRYELHGIRADEPIVVRAEAEGFAPGTSAEVRAQTGQTVSNVDVQLAPAGSVRVLVTGDAPPFAMVSAQPVGEAGERAATAPVVGMLRGGKASLAGLRPGRWRVQLSGIGGEELAEEVEVVAGETAEVRFAR